MIPPHSTSILGSLLALALAMAIRKGHGRGAGVPRVEVLPADELPAGVPARSGDPIPGARDPGGRFVRGAATSALAAQAGAANAGKTRLASRLGLSSLPHDCDFARYKAAAVSFRRAQCTELARVVGGGICGPAPSSLIASAALQLAWSRYLGDLAAAQNDPDLALKSSRLAEASRQSLLAAHELCAREAESRRKVSGPSDPLARFMPTASKP